MTALDKDGWQQPVVSALLHRLRAAFVVHSVMGTFAHHIDYVGLLQCLVLCWLLFHSCMHELSLPGVLITKGINTGQHPFGDELSATSNLCS